MMSKPFAELYPKGETELRKTGNNTYTLYEPWIETINIYVITKGFHCTLVNPGSRARDIKRCTALFQRLDVFWAAFSADPENMKNARAN